MSESIRFRKRKMRDCRDWGSKLKRIRQRTSSDHRSISSLRRSLWSSRCRRRRLRKLWIVSITMLRPASRETWNLKWAFAPCKTRTTRFQTRILSTQRSQTQASYLLTKMTCTRVTIKISRRVRLSLSTDRKRSEKLSETSIQKKLSTNSSRKSMLWARSSANLTRLESRKPWMKRSIDCTIRTWWRNSWRKKLSANKCTKTWHSSQRSMAFLPESLQTHQLLSELRIKKWSNERNSFDKSTRSIKTRCALLSLRSISQERNSSKRRHLNMRLKTASNFQKTLKLSKKLKWLGLPRRDEIRNFRRKKIAHLSLKSSRMHHQPQPMMSKSKVWAEFLNFESFKRKKRPKYCSVKQRSLVWTTNSQSTLISVISRTQNPVRSSLSGPRQIQPGPTRPSQSLSIS